MLAVRLVTQFGLISLRRKVCDQWLNFIETIQQWYSLGYYRSDGSFHLITSYIPILGPLILERCLRNAHSQISNRAKVKCSIRYWPNVKVNQLANCSKLILLGVNSTPLLFAPYFNYIHNCKRTLVLKVCVRSGAFYVYFTSKKHNREQRGKV